MKYLKNYIGGELVDAASGAWIDSYDPAIGAVYSQVPDSDADDVARAVASAQQVFDDWSATPASERADHMRRIANLIEKNLAALAQAESADQGKPVALATKVDIPLIRRFAFGNKKLHHQPQFTPWTEQRRSDDRP